VFYHVTFAERFYYRKLFFIGWLLLSFKRSYHWLAGGFGYFPYGGRLCFYKINKINREEFLLNYCSYCIDVSIKNFLEARVVQSFYVAENEHRIWTTSDACFVGEVEIFYFPLVTGKYFPDFQVCVRRFFEISFYNKFSIVDESRKDVPISNVQLSREYRFNFRLGSRLVLNLMFFLNRL